MPFSMQKQSSRNLVISPNSQIAYGGVLADLNLTTRQRADTSTGFSPKPTNRTDKMMIGKGSEWATDDQITSWDVDGTIKSEADIFLLGWMLAFIFGQEVVTGAGPYNHAFTLPSVTSTMPCTTIYVEETAAVHRKVQDMSAKAFSLSVPERGALNCSLDMVGTGRWTPGSMAALPALVQAIYLLGSDMQVTITPTAGVAVPFVGRQKGLTLKVERGTMPFQSSGDGLYAASNVSGDGKFSVDLTIAANAVDDVNGWFEAGTRCAVTIATNPANTYQVGFTFPSVRIKANKLANASGTVTWALSWDETTTVSVGGASAISAFVLNNTTAYLIPA